MTKILHFLIFAFFVLFFNLCCFSQTQRVKIYKTENNSILRSEETNQHNINEGKAFLNSDNATNTNISQLRDTNTVSLKSAKSINTLKQNSPAAAITITDNVTYEKINLPSGENTVSSEKKSTKISPSVNYKQKSIREDIHPLPAQYTGTVNQEKRVYLEQEAMDLELEIKNNSAILNSELIEKQKRLDYIKSLLKN